MLRGVIFFMVVVFGSICMLSNAAEPDPLKVSSDDLKNDSVAFIYALSDSGGTVNYFRDKRLDIIFNIQKDINSKKQGIPGYRVQLYRGNSQKLSKNRALEIEAMVYRKFGEDIHVDVIFKTPYWRVQAGSFRLQSEAMKEEARFKQAFPEIADDISVVPAIIEFPEIGKKKTEEYSEEGSH